MINVLNYAAAAGLAVLILYLMTVGSAILLPLVIAAFVCYLINALAAVTRDIRIWGPDKQEGERIGDRIIRRFCIRKFEIQKRRMMQPPMVFPNITAETQSALSCVLGLLRRPLSDCGDRSH